MLPHHERQIVRLRELKERLIGLKKGVQALEEKKKNLENEVSQLGTYKVEREQKSEQHDKALSRETEDMMRIIEEIMGTKDPKE